MIEDKCKIENEIEDKKDFNHNILMFPNTPSPILSLTPNSWSELLGI